MTSEVRSVVSALAIGFVTISAGVGQGATNGDEIIFRNTTIDSTQPGGATASYVIHAYTSVGGSATFTRPAGVNEVEYLIVAGGGSGGTSAYRGGGGGAGELIESGRGANTPFELGAQDTWDIVVGDGGIGVGYFQNEPRPPGGTASRTNSGIQGDPSSAFGMTANGGGGGGATNGLSGGSGGGGGTHTSNVYGGGSASTTGGGAGHGGGSGTASDTLAERSAGGGGGAGSAGSSATVAPGGGDSIGGDGGDSVSSLITGTLNYYAGGGGGGSSGTIAAGAGGYLSGGAGGLSGTDIGESGAANTGGGGGGAYGGNNRISSGAGGSGIVVVRYQLSSVTEYGQDGAYSLDEDARHVRIEDDVNVRVQSGGELFILDGGSLTVGKADGSASARLDVQGEVGLGTGSTFVVESGGAVGGSGVVFGGLTLADGAKFQFRATNTLTATGGVVDLGALGVGDLLGLSAGVVQVGQIYTLIDGTATFLFGNVRNKSDDPYNLGDGKLAYFKEGSLQLVVIPEPHTLGLLLAAGALLSLRRRRGGVSSDR